MSDQKGVDTMDALPPDPAAPPTRPPPQSPLPTNYEYDFVNEPPKDFYCAVSLELLLEPQQTDCCGHHFTREVVERLERSGKPCPMCKEPRLTTHADKYHKRRVNEVAVRCLHREAGNCEWVGELGNLPYHVTNCPKQPWRCTYCEFDGLKESESEHCGVCTMFPVACPNKCEVGTIPRSMLAQHKLECQLEEISCEYAELGCTKRFPRMDLKKHMEEGEVGHLLKMCTMNIGLTQQLVRKVEEKDSQMAQLRSQLVAMEDKLKKSVQEVQENTSTRILDVERRVESETRGLADRTARSESSLLSSIDAVRSSLADVQLQVNAFSCKVPPIEFVVTNFVALKQHKLEWRSPPFFTHHGGYKMCLGVSPNGVQKGFGTHVSLRFYKMLDLNSDSLTWDIKIRLRVRVQNQITNAWDKEYTDDSIRSKPSSSCVGSSAEYHFLRHSELGSYVKHDQMKIRITEFTILQ